VPHFYPVVIPAGRSLPGDSLGFHAYSLRIDNLTNQWLLEETSLAWIPPYSLGVCLRLYGTGVAIVLNQAPSGQAQPAPLAGEATVGVFSDQLRTEVAGSPVRQFALVQAVSDLTEGAQPAFPPVGTCRLWADNTGTIHHEHSDGTDYVVLDAHNFTSYVTPPYVLNIVNTQALGGVLAGTLPNPTHANINHVFPANVSAQNFAATAVGQGLSGTYPGAVTGPLVLTTGDSGGYSSFYCGPAGLLFVNSANTVRIASILNNGEFQTQGRISAGPIIANSPGDIGANRGGGAGVLYLGDGTHYLFNPGAASAYQLTGAPLVIAGGGLTANGNINFTVGTQLLAWPDGTNMYANGGMVITLPNTAASFYNSSTARYMFSFSPTGFAYSGFNGGGLTVPAGDTRMRIFNGVSMTATVGAIFSVTPGVTGFHGIVMIIINSAQMIMCSLNGGAHAVNIIWSNCSATNAFGVGTTFNVGWSVSDYFLENRTGAGYAYYVFAFGIN
jgi:hypothetical protein